MAVAPIDPYGTLFRTRQDLIDEAQAIEDARPYAGPPTRGDLIVTFDDVEYPDGQIQPGIASIIRKHGLQATVKGLVDRREGFGVYEDLRQNAGQNDLEILENVVGLPKRRLPRLRAMQQEGLNIDDMAQVFLNELALDADELRRESGVQPKDVFMAFTEGVRDISEGEAFTEGALRGAVSGSAFTTAAGLAGLAASPLGGPFALASGLVAGTGALFAADAATSVILPKEEILSPTARGFMETGKVLTEGLTGMGLPKVLQKGTAIALNAESGFLKQLGDSIRSRDFNLLENPNFVEGITPEDLRYFQATDPVAFEIMRTYQKNPISSSLGELPSIAGASIAAGFAERQGQEGFSRIATEVTGGLAGQTLAGTFNIVPFFTGAKNKLQETELAEAFEGDQGRARVGAALRAILFEFGEGKVPADGNEETLDHIIETLRNPEYQKLLKASNEDYDENIRPLLAGLKAADGTPLITPSSATITGSEVFKGIQGTLEARSATYRAQMEKTRAAQAQAVNAVINALRTTGNPQDIQYATFLTQRYFEDEINRTLLNMIDNAERVGDRLLPDGDVNNASRKINSLILRVFNDVNQQENALYDLVPDNIEVGSQNFFEAIQATKDSYDPSMISTIFPKAIQQSDQQARDALEATVLQSQIDELARDPNAISRGPRIQALQRQLDELTVDLDNPTYEQRKRYRSYLLKLATQSASGAAPELAPAAMYRDLANGIERDLTDLQTLQDLNGPEAVDGDTLFHVQNAKSFSKAKNDVFLRAFPNMALIDKATGEDYVDPELLYQKILAGADDASRLRMQEIKKAVLFLTDKATPGGLSGVEGAEMNAFLNSLELDQQLEVVTRSLLDNPQYFTKRFNDQGELESVIPNGEALERFAQNNKQQLDLFPGLMNDLLDARTAGIVAQRSIAQAEKAKKDFLTPLFVSFTGEKPSIGILQMRGGKNPERTLTYEISRMRAAVARANQGGQIGGSDFRVVQDRLDAGDFTLENFDDALRGAIFQSARDFATTGEGQKQLIAGLPNFTEIRSYFFDTMPQSNQTLMNVLLKEGVFTEAESLRLQQLLTVGEGAQEKIKAANFDVTEDITTMGDEFVSLFSRLLGAKAGTMLGQVLPGTDPNSLITAGAGSRFVQRILESIPVTSTYDILQEAIRDPEAMALLLEAGEKFNLPPVDMGTRFFEAEGFAEKAKQFGKTAKQFAKEQALKTAALNSFIRNAIGIRPAQEFVIEDEATAEELQEVREMKMRGGFQPQRRQQQRQDVIERAVLEEQQPILPATLPTPPPTVQSFTQTPPQGAPNPQQRQQFAALFPNDPLSGLIQQQGIASLPQAPG
jgi:hypothetical protein|tara:strand:+ start:7207 stop:11214 length:4008 start_codon:yes stop_codon:yes gene_type:complete